MRHFMIVALAATVFFAGAARADTVQLHGNKLMFTSATDDDTSIEVDSALTGGVRVIADDPSCLITHDGADIVVDTSGCGDKLGHLTIEVPQGFGLMVNIQNSGNVVVGSTGGEFAANISGNGDLHVGRIGALQLVVNGSGDTTIQKVSGAANITSAANGDIRIPELDGMLNSHQSSSGDLVIGRIGAAAVNLVLTGSGDAIIGPGNVGALHAETDGSGDVSMASTVGTANLSASGGGDIRIAHVTGSVQRHSSGDSDISTTGTGLTGSLLSKLASVGAGTIITADGQTIHISDGDGETNISLGRGDSGGNTFHHILGGAAIIFLCYVIWRAVQRRGGMSTVASQIRARSGPPGQPTHPGVIAVRDKLAELEAKLARVEMYVTNREFDLHRKFRELDT